MNLTEKNKILNDEEISQRRIILKSFPRRLIATITTKCNANCIMCEVKNFKWDMPKRVFAEIMELFPYLESIAWQGGEVFYLDDFEEVFDEAVKFKNMKQTIVTNGLLLNKDWIEKILNTNMELAISIDGVTKDVYEKIRKGSKYDLLMNNLNMLNGARKKGNSRLELRLHTVIMKSNYRQAEGFIELARQHNFDALHFMPIYGEQDIDENIFLYKDEGIFGYLREKIKVIEHKAKEYKIEFLNSMPLCDVKKETEEASPDPDAQSEEFLCYLPWQQLNIDPGGEVRPGCICSQSVGSVLENSLTEIWNSRKMQSYRKMIAGEKNTWCGDNCLNGNVPVELRRI